MTREDASNILCELKENGLFFSQRLAIDMAIEALKEPEQKRFSMSKKILDVTCGSRSIWFNKHHPDAIYMDRRQEHFEATFGQKNGHRTIDVNPDVLADFTDIPFPDNTFSLVVFDPPHLLKGAESTAWLVKKYGRLDENWPTMIHDGFQECMRVLKPDGVLIFKWSETNIPANDLWKAIGEKPLFGHHSGKMMKTFWACFMKGSETNG